VPRLGPRNDVGIAAGQSQDYAFVVEDEAPGFAVILATTDNETTVTWSLEGTLGNVSSSTSTSSGGSLSPTGSGPFSGAQGTDIPHAVIAVMAVACLLGFMLL